MSYVDFATLKAQVKIEDVATDMLGATLTAQGGQLRGRCPIHRGNHPREFVITPAKGAFFCFDPACNSGGDMIELAARALNVSLKDAARAIALHFKIATDGKPPAETAKPAAKAQESVRDGFDPVAYAKTLEPGHEVLKDIGVSKETLEEFGAGYAKTGILRGRLAVSVCDAGGTILGFVGVSLKKGEEPYLLFPKGFDNHVFFNTHRIGSGPLYLFRDPLSVMRAASNGAENCIAVWTDLSPDILECLATFMRERKSDSLEIY